MVQARLYKPSKNVMQSGRGKTIQWVLEYQPETPKRPEALMGWTSAGDTLGQVSIRFESKEAALAFAASRNLEVAIAQEHKRRIKPLSYLDNFKFRPPEEDSQK